MNEVRYYAGRVKCAKLSKTTVMNTALYEALEDGTIGTKDLPREIKKGEFFLCPVRRCFKSPCSLTGKARGVRTRGMGGRNPPRASTKNKKGSD